jgi:hypothetical protein
VEKSWTLLGQYDSKARTSFFGMALAVYIAMETFGSHQHRYQVTMCVLILLSSAYIAKKAFAAKSILGGATALFGAIWIAPIVNSSVFYSVDLYFMLAHSILSIAVAVGAFSYLKS